MKNKKFLEEIREITSEELIKMLDAKRKDLFDIRFKAHPEELSNNAKINGIKRDIARIKTVLRMKHNIKK